MVGTLPKSTFKNHGSAMAEPDLIQSYLDKDCGLGATCGRFPANPLCTKLIISPLQIAHSRSGKSRVVVDLSFPSGFSVNDGIPKDSYLDESLGLRLPGTDALVAIILQKGPVFRHRTPCISTSHSFGLAFCRDDVSADHFGSLAYVWQPWLSVHELY